jgi:hypothetical protein
MGILLDNVRQGFNLLFTPVLYYGVVWHFNLPLGRRETGLRIRFRISMQIRLTASTSLSVN